MKKSARPGIDPTAEPGGSVLVAAFAALSDAEAALAELPGAEIVGTGLSPAPFVARTSARRVGSGVLLGVAAALLVGGALALLDLPGAGPAPVLAGCLLVGVLTGLGGALRAAATPVGAGTVLVGRYELRAPASVARALRDRLRAAAPGGLLELGTPVGGRPGLVPAPLGALDDRVRTADEALGLSPQPQV